MMTLALWSCLSPRIGRSLIGDNLSRDDLGRADGLLKEPASRPSVALS
jgi:hypothetical protein